jgi:hypothetical protein
MNNLDRIGSVNDFGRRRARATKLFFTKSEAKRRPRDNASSATTGKLRSQLAIWWHFNSYQNIVANLGIVWLAMPSNLERKASRAKRQTRLTFEATDLPAGSSSPQASKLTAAKVRYGTRGKNGVFAVRTPPPKIQFAVDSDATLGIYELC